LSRLPDLDAVRKAVEKAVPFLGKYVDIFDKEGRVLAGGKLDSIEVEVWLVTEEGMGARAENVVEIHEMSEEEKVDYLKPKVK